MWWFKRVSFSLSKFSLLLHSKHWSCISFSARFLISQNFLTHASQNLFAPKCTSVLWILPSWSTKWTVFVHNQSQIVYREKIQNLVRPIHLQHLLQNQSVWDTMPFLGCKIPKKFPTRLKVLIKIFRTSKKRQKFLNGFKIFALLIQRASY